MDSVEKKLFHYDYLNSKADELSEGYRLAKPFPHAVIDNFAEPELLEDALSKFPGPKDMQWFKYKNPLEIKLAQNTLELLPPIFRRILWELNAGPFVKFLEKLTGIEGLIPDPNYIGGGLHQIERGGKLDTHLDFNWHSHLKLDRRINAIIYLNKNWKEEYGGALELWDSEMKGPPTKVLPVFNRAVIFNTTDFSPHGHPDPLTCPEGWTRKSLALYYYSNGRPDEEKKGSHSTVYKRRPQDDPALDELREKRAKGRLQDDTT